MGQSLVQIYIHIVFSTKHRQPFLKDGEFRTRTHAYLAGIMKNSDCPTLVMGGVEDHVHLLCRMGKQIAISDMLRELK
jgi:REP element-mobilizing transposase RayT